MFIRRIGVAMIGLGSLVATSAQASGLDVSLSDKTADFTYLTDSGSLGYGGADIGVGVFYNENSDVLLHGQIMVTGKPLGEKNKGVQFGVGGKVYAGELDDLEEDVLAVALGAQLRYLIPAATPVGIMAEVFVAPDITSFSDTESMKEFNFRVELEVMPSTRGYVGYRRLEPELERAGDVELDDEFHVGIRVTF